MSDIDVGIFYASSSGRTRRVVDLMRLGLSRASIEVFDLRSAEISSLSSVKLAILGSPTYGVGELHPVWQRWRKELKNEPSLRPQEEVAMFALGDELHHGETFAGALWQLEEMVKSWDSKRIGQLEPSVPGLVLDAVSQRSGLSFEVSRWIGQLRSQSSVLDSEPIGQSSEDIRDLSRI